MLIEASKRKVLLKTFSIEKDKGTGDLLKDEPYGTHLRWAKRGYIDAYHSGFPCATFSRLKFREVEGLPGPIRTKEEPYGRRSNTGREQQSCDDGTIMACRSINIADAVADKRTVTKVRPIATLENPPESDHPQHLSAWELPEMKEFTKKSGRRVSSVQHLCLSKSNTRWAQALQTSKVRRHPHGHRATLQTLWVR